MQALIPIIPFSDLRSRSKQVLEQLKGSPVVLTLRGRPSAVLIDYDAYKAMVQKQQMLEMALQQAQMPKPSLAEAAEMLLVDYTSDEELTAFTALDGEDFHAAE
ncbi:MAG: type II toxin-antitoxin system Phd/YefM family antitoxin [Anaerolineae bacterium]